MRAVPLFLLPILDIGHRKGETISGFAPCKEAPSRTKAVMKRFHRSRLLLRGLHFLSAVRCIRGLARVRGEKPSPDFDIAYEKFGRRLAARVRGKHLRSDLQSVLELAAGDCYHLAEIEWEPEVVLDGGGNTALFSLAAGARWPACRVRCFEPLPANVDLIRQHLELNGLSARVELVPTAVGGSARTAKFFVRAANQGSLDEALQFGEAIDVNVLRLWEIYASVSSRRVLIKLDVEGAEFEILGDFFRHVPLRQLVFVMEVHGDRERQDRLLNEACAAGLVGGFWEQARETAHLFCASEDVGCVMRGITA